MKIRKIWKPLGAVVLAAGLSVTGISAKEEETAAAETEAEQAAVQSLLQDSADAQGKSETIYIFTDESGTQQSVIVSDRLKNGSGLQDLTDFSRLSNITNVTGEEPFTRNPDGSITWQADGNDICYQGTTDEEMPIRIHITYTLDGQVIPASEMQGRSGHVKIRFTYSNLATASVLVNGVQRKATVPFAMTSGLTVDPDHWTNISVTNGRLIDDGKHTMIVGMAFPGLEEALNLASISDTIGDIDIPDYVEIEADVTDFETSMVLTIASPNLLNSLDVDNDALSNATSGIQDLADAMDEILDGAQELKDGTADLQDGVSQVSDGAKELSDGAKTVSDSTEQIYSGLHEALNSSDYQALLAGMNTLASGSDASSAGLPYLIASYGQTMEGLEQIAEGLAQLDQAVTAASGTSLDADTISAINAAVTEAQNAMTAIGTDVTSLGSDVTAIAQDLQNIADDAEAIAAAAQATTTTTVEGEEVHDASQDVTDDPVTGEPVCSEELTESTDANGNTIYIQTCTVTETVTVHEHYVRTDTTTVAPDTAALASALSALQTDLSAYQTHAAAYAQHAQVYALDTQGDGTSDHPGLSATIAPIIQSLSTLQSALGSLSQLQPAIAALDAGMNTDVLAEDGTIQQYSAMTAVRAVYQGLQQAQSGASSLNAGLQTLNTSLSAVDGYLGQLSSGTRSLYDGAKKLSDNTPTLLNGARDLDQGAQDLLDGLNTFNEEGIQELQEKLGTSLQNVLDNIQAVQLAGKSYTNFSGEAASSEDDDLTFVIKSDGISASEDSSEDSGDE